MNSFVSRKRMAGSAALFGRMFAPAVPVFVGAARMRMGAVRARVTQAHMLAAVHVAVLAVQVLALVGLLSQVLPLQSAVAEPITLAGAVARAQAKYPSVRAAQAAERAAAAAVGQPAAERWPSVRAQGSFVRYEEPSLVRPLHSFDLTAAPPEFDDTLLRGDLSVGWTLFEGGARVARVSGARAEAADASAARESAEMALTTQVTRAYLQVLATRGVLDAESRHTESLASERRRVEQLLEQGRAARVELLRVQAALAQAEAARVATTTRLDLAERSLARFVDLPPDAVRAGNLQPVQLATARAVREDVPEERAALFEAAVLDNPDLERARRRLEAAEAARRVARAAWFPKLDAFGSYLGYGSDSGDGTLEWQAGFGVSYPLFTAGGRRSAVSRAGALAEAAREEFRLAELQVEQELDRALNAVLEARSVVEAVALSVQHQTEVVRIEQLSLDSGSGTQTDYLRAEADLLRARSALVEAEHTEIAAHVELARVLGELTPEWIDANLESEP